MTVWKVGDYAKRNDNGRRVYIAEVMPNGDRVFYRTEDAIDGHTSIIEGRQLRPVTE